jgi:hypothetical protein
MKIRLIAACALAAACGLAFAKIPAPQLDDAAKAKAAEAAAKTAWQAKVDAWQLCKAQDRVAAVYAKSSGKPVPVPVKAAAAPAAKPAVSTTPPANPPSAPTTGQAPSSAPPPCSDPGPFAYSPPEQKPLETSGAHSPASNATSPPSVNKPSAEMTPGKKS